MIYECSVSTCRSPAASAYTRLCPIHKVRKRRHGSPDQQRVSKKDLAPYIRRVKARIDKNPQSPVWGTLEARWGTVLAHSRRIVADYHAGCVSVKHERRAAVEALKVGDATRPMAVTETVLAMVMMLHMEPRRFPTDEGFRAQLVRQVRSLSGLCFGQGWSQQTGRVKHYYRDVPPRAVKVLWGWLLEAFGDAAVRVAMLEIRDIEVEQAAKQAQIAALGSLA